MAHLSRRNVLGLGVGALSAPLLGRAKAADFSAEVHGLVRYGHLERIPESAADWDVPVRGAARLAATLVEQRERARLFRTLATLRPGAPIGVDVDGLRWAGPRSEFAAWAGRLGTPALHERAAHLAATRAAAR